MLWGVASRTGVLAAGLKEAPPARLADGVFFGGRSGAESPGRLPPAGLHIPFGALLLQAGQVLGGNSPGRLVLNDRL